MTSKKRKGLEISHLIKCISIVHFYWRGKENGTQANSQFLLTKRRSKSIFDCAKCKRRMARKDFGYKRRHGKCSMQTKLRIYNHRWSRSAAIKCSSPQEIRVQSQNFARIIFVVVVFSICFILYYLELKLEEFFWIFYKCWIRLNLRKSESLIKRIVCFSWKISMGNYNLTRRKISEMYSESWMNIKLLKKKNINLTLFYVLRVVKIVNFIWKNCGYSCESAQGKFEFRLLGYFFLSA